ncbi:hypothetical protein GFS24_08800 [Chitinophaga sp. SYP-B3965]|uniref:tetratricopeptide repeat-containing sensor histidine kinase n=1 Tax=Chitinophaga sp. SYP-B3965 TaxID=2663120 RepID=UPI00129A0AA5|nr:sensor histidine kinase [Chitinophaga sp. SYP-B3965]MRG45211.1 hypothetical protein [Chitinophaga sp. SYP-B3965]
MRKQVLLLSLLCSFFSTGYSQYIPGEKFVNENEIPGLRAQLKTNMPAQKKTELLLNISLGYLYKTFNLKIELDSAMLYAQEANILSTQINNAALINESLLVKSMIWMEGNAMDSAKWMLPVLNDSNRLKMNLCLSKFYYEMQAPLAYEHQHLDSAAHFAQAAVKLAAKTKVLQSTALLWLHDIAKTYHAHQLLSYAEKQYLLMLEYSDGVSYPSKVHIFSWLCSIFTHEADLYKAMGYGIAAEKALNRNSTDHELSLVNIKLGSMYTMQGKYDKALLYFGNILAQPERYSATINIYAVANSYCNALRKEKRNDEVLPWLQKFHQRYPARINSDKCYYHLILAHTYNEMNAFEPAEKNFLEAIRYSELDKSQPAFIYSYLGALYHKFNHHEKALNALKIAEKGILGEDELAVANNFTYMSQSEAALGNYENAYFYILKSKGILDSVYVVSKEKHTQELEVQYQTQKKEADLRLKEENIRFLNQHAQLLEQDAKIQQTKLEAASLLSENNEIELKLQKKDIEILTKSSILQLAEIERANAKRRVTVLIIILLAVIIALLVWLFWTKLRSNKVITNKNGLLQQLLKDKSWLLKEMHHRIKNNLHIIMNLLEFQSSHLHDDALEAIKNSQSRIFSMSLIHQKLYQTDDAKTIDMVYYIPELVSYLKDSFNLQHNSRINMDIDHTAFHVTEAVPLGLIINEAVTNSMKHAFKNNRYGEISISLKATGKDQYELIMADNGTGLSEDFDIENVTSLGFQLIKGLSDQLEAQLRIVNENGLKITLSAISVYKAIKFKTMENELKEQLAI